MTVQELLQKYIASQIPISFLLGEVTQVSQDTNTCDVLPIGASAPILAVRLCATVDNTDSGIRIVPVVGSYVCLALLDDKSGEAFVCMYSDVDYIQEKSEKLTFKRDLTLGEITLNTQKIEIAAQDIQFNNGTNGGLANVNPITQDIQTIKFFLQTLTTAIQAAPVVPGDGGASFKAALIAAISALPMPAITGYEDNSITH